MSTTRVMQLPHHIRQATPTPPSSLLTRTLTLVLRIDRRLWRILVANGVILSAMLTLFDIRAALRLLFLLNLGAGAYRLVVWPVLEQRRRASLAAVGFLERARLQKHADFIDYAQRRREQQRQHLLQQHIQRRPTPSTSRHTSPQRQHQQRPVQPSSPPNPAAAATAVSTVLSSSSLSSLSFTDADST